MSPPPASKKQQQDSSGLLDPKTMDGPVIQHTVADLFQFNSRLFMTYHVSSAGFQALGTVGSLVGGALYGVGLLLHRPFLPTVWAVMGTSGLVGGAAGAGLGLSGMAATAAQGPAATPVPWTDEGIQQRVDGLRHNYLVRVMDRSLRMGVGLAAGALLYAGGPSKLKLSSGWLGVGQALSLGSTVGMLGAVGCIWSTERLSSKDFEEEDGSDNQRGGMQPEDSEQFATIEQCTQYR